VIKCVAIDMVIDGAVDMSATFVDARRSMVSATLNFVE
jgi:hypothetical protein